VAWLFLLEACLLGAIATTTGAVAGGLVAGGLNALHLVVPEGVQIFLMSRTLTLSVNVGEILKDVVVVTAATTLTALFPALRASRLQPITAMQHFG
jgi:putative ABC transport system permease protein